MSSVAARVNHDIRYSIDEFTYKPGCDQQIEHQNLPIFPGFVSSLNYQLSSQIGYMGRPHSKRLLWKENNERPV